MRVQRNRIALTMILSAMILSTSSFKISLKEEPAQAKVLIGQPVVLKCRIDIPKNVVKVKLQWSKDMFGLENSTIQDVYKGRISIPGLIESGNYDLHFKTTEPSDEALYACHIELTFKGNDGENIESIIGKGSLKVIEPPKDIFFEFQTDNKSFPSTIWQPRDSVVWGLQNHKLKFTCLSTGGNPIPQLSWSLKSQKEFSDLENINRLNTNEISLSPELHNSTLICTVENRKDYLESPLPQAKLNIRVLYFHNPIIERTNGKIEQPIYNGETVSFTCTSSNTPEAIVYYSWYIEYNNPEKTNNEFLVKKSSSNSIILKSSVKHHHSRLHCILQSTMEQPRCDTTMNKYCKIQLRQKVTALQVLNVLYPPKIKIPFENITITNIGEWVILTCDVESNPPASIKWFKTQIGTSKHARSINWYFQTSISNLIDSLTIDNIISSMSYHKFQIVNDNDLDIYVCQASSVGHPNVYKYVVVAKEEEPTIKIIQPMIKVERDGTASVMCLIESWPKPSISRIKWYHEGSEAQIYSTERRYFVNKRQLMGVESKLYFKKVINSDFGIYTCSISHGTKIISKQIHLLASNNKFTLYIAGGILGSTITFIVIVVAICMCKKNICNKKKKCKKAPLQTMMLPSPTLDSNIDNEIFINRLHSLPGYSKDNILSDSLVLPSNRCFIYHNQQNTTSKLPCGGESHHEQNDKSVKKGNERSWDSGMGTEDPVYRTGAIFQNHRGSNGMSPFSTLNSSNNSIGPLTQNNTNSRFWQPYQPVDLNSKPNLETGSSRLTNTDNSTFSGSLRSNFLSPQNENLIPLIATTANQSFVCIPIEEYQQHMRILQESQGPPSLRSYSIASYSTNNGNSTFHPNCQPHNGNPSPTEDSVKFN